MRGCGILMHITSLPGPYGVGTMGKYAYEFIDFISSYDYAYDNSGYVGYTSPNKEVAEALYAEGGDYEGINAYVPRVGYEYDEVFFYNEETRKVIANMWSKVKIAASNAN